jgi:hypothetical protein
MNTVIVHIIAITISSVNIPNLHVRIVSWFGLFVPPYSHTCNSGQVNYRLKFLYYSTTYNVRTSTQYNIINNNTKYIGQLDVKSVSTSR